MSNCRHCNERPGSHSRGLCRRCYRTPGVADRYPKRRTGPPKGTAQRRGVARFDGGGR